MKILIKSNLYPVPLPRSARDRHGRNSDVSILRRYRFEAGMSSFFCLRDGLIGTVVSSLPLKQMVSVFIVMYSFRYIYIYIYINILYYKSTEFIKIEIKFLFVLIQLILVQLQNIFVIFKEKAIKLVKHLKLY